MTRRIFFKVLLVAVAIFGLLVLSGVLSAQGRREQALKHAKEVQEKHTDALMARPGVVGTAVGLNDNGDYAVLVLLEIPGAPGIPEHLGNVPVRPVVTGKFYARVDPTSWFPRPVPTGVSTGHPDITAGTISCRVTDGTSVYTLSNNHVYADENKANIGDNVLQPGTYDGGEDPGDAIGTLVAFEPIVFSESAYNIIDAAIALTTVELVNNKTPSDGYGTPSSATTEAVLRQKVQKYGRTTGLTNGRVAGINATVYVGYDSGTARFVDQILIKPGSFSAGGDSGSLIVTENGNNPVGLLFAGSQLYTVANPIDPVLSRFGVTVDDSEGPVDNPPNVSITNPADGATVSGTVIVTASASDDNGVTQVEFLVDGGIIGVDSDGSNGWSASWDTTGYSEGSHTVTATATDTVGQTASDSIGVTVDNEPSAGVTVTSITPNLMTAGSTENVTIEGSGFVDGANVTFENGSGRVPTASVTSVSANEIIATVTAKSGGPPRNRVWDVRVTNPDGSSGVLVGGFTVMP